MVKKIRNENEGSRRRRSRKAKGVSQGGRQARGRGIEAPGGSPKRSVRGMNRSDSPKSEHLANDLSVSNAELWGADGAVLAVMEDLHSPLPRHAPVHQPHPQPVCKHNAPTRYM